MEASRASAVVTVDWAIPGIAAALRGLDSKTKERISRRQLVRNRQLFDIA
jgi:hypothetical protein